MRNRKSELLAAFAKARERRPLIFANATSFYSRSTPSAANAVNIYRGEWSSRLPDPLGVITGLAPQFEDPVISWALGLLGPAADADVLELGPLEAGHTYMLHMAGVRSITAVEGNERAFLKCLIVKELFRLDRARFLHGDFIPYLATTTDRFAFCLASGVLYHQLDPIRLLGLIARVAPRVLVWTVYHDPAALQTRARLRRRMRGERQSISEGFPHTLHRHVYGYSLRRYGFCGGANRESNWLSRDDLLGALRHVGFADLHIAFEDRDHPNGPTIAVFASREL